MEEKKMESTMQHILTSHGTDQQDPLPPPPPAYTESTPTFSTAASISTQTIEPSEAMKNTDSKPKRDWFWKMTGRMNKKPQEPAAAKRWDIDCRADEYPRLIQLVRSPVDPTHLLRGILVYILLESFRGGDKIYEMHADGTSTFDFGCVLTTRTNYDPGKYFNWEAEEITDDICNLVRDLEYQMSNGRWHEVRQAHKDLLVYFILKPTEDLKIQADYALEILGSFKRVKKDDAYVIATLVGHWKPRNKEERKDSHRMLDFGDTVASHVSFITSLHLPKERQHALEESMASYLLKFDLDSIQMSNTLKKIVLDEQKNHPGETCCWPMRDSYMELFWLLGKPDNSGWRDILKKERKNRF